MARLARASSSESYGSRDNRQMPSVLRPEGQAVPEAYANDLQQELTCLGNAISESHASQGARAPLARHFLEPALKWC